jgi:glutamate dehydrogenase (NADP+)
VRSIHARCHETAQEYDHSGELVLGANAGFLPVPEAVQAQGLVWLSPSPAATDERL